jgi:hypothetical protein
MRAVLNAVEALAAAALVVVCTQFLAAPALAAAYIQSLAGPVLVGAYTQSLVVPVLVGAYTQSLVVPVLVGAYTQSLVVPVLVGVCTQFLAGPALAVAYTQAVVAGKTLSDSLAGVVVPAGICSQIEAVVIAEVGDQTASLGLVVQLAVEVEMSDEDLEADNQAASSPEVLGIQAVPVSVEVGSLQLVAAFVVAARNPQL